MSKTQMKLYAIFYFLFSFHGLASCQEEKENEEILLSNQGTQKSSKGDTLDDYVTMMKKVPISFQSFAVSYFFEKKIKKGDFMWLLNELARRDCYEGRYGSSAVFQCIEEMVNRGLPIEKKEVLDLLFAIYEKYLDYALDHIEERKKTKENKRLRPKISHVDSVVIHFTQMITHKKKGHFLQNHGLFISKWEGYITKIINHKEIQHREASFLSKKMVITTIVKYLRLPKNVEPLLLLNLYEKMGSLNGPEKDLKKSEALFRCFLYFKDSFKVAENNKPIEKIIAANEKKKIVKRFQALVNPQLFPDAFDERASPFPSDILLTFLQLMSDLHPERDLALKQLVLYEKRLDILDLLKGYKIVFQKNGSLCSRERQKEYQALLGDMCGLPQSSFFAVCQALSVADPYALTPSLWKQFGIAHQRSLSSHPGTAKAIPKPKWGQYWRTESEKCTFEYKLEKLKTQNNNQWHSCCEKQKALQVLRHAITKSPLPWLYVSFDTFFVGWLRTLQVGQQLPARICFLCNQYFGTKKDAMRWRFFQSLKIGKALHKVDNVEEKPMALDTLRGFDVKAFLQLQPTSALCNRTWHLWTEMFLTLLESHDYSLLTLEDIASIFGDYIPHQGAWKGTQNVLLSLPCAQATHQDIIHGLMLSWEKYVNKQATSAPLLGMLTVEMFHKFKKRHSAHSFLFQTLQKLLTIEGTQVHLLKKSAEIMKVLSSKAQNQLSASLLAKLVGVVQTKTYEQIKKNFLKILISCKPNPKAVFDFFFAMQRLNTSKKRSWGYFLLGKSLDEQGLDPFVEMLTKEDQIENYLTICKEKAYEIPLQLYGDCILRLASALPQREHHLKNI